MSTNSANSNSPLIQLEDTLNVYFGQKAPALPENIKELIVKYGPWVTLVLLILAAVPLLGVIGLGALLSPIALMSGVSYGGMYLLTLAFSVAIIVLEAIAIPKLLKRQKSGWNLVFYASLLSSVSSLLSRDIFGLIIGTLLSFYILFQIRSYYK